MRFLLYPCTGEFASVFEFAQIVDSDVDIVAIVSPRGWGLVGREVRNSEGDAIFVQSDIGEVHREYEGIFVPELCVSERVEEKLIDEITRKCTNIKKIICCAALASRNLEYLQQYCSEQKCKLEYRPTKQVEALPQNSNNVEVPVIAVSSVFPSEEQAEISLRLTRELKNKGYRVTVLGRQKSLEYFGGHSLPDWLFEELIDARRAICDFSNYVADVARSERCDIVLIQIPYPIQNPSEMMVYDYGLSAYIIFQALNIDYHICCIHYIEDFEKYFKQLNSLSYYRFNAGIDTYYVENKYIDFVRTAETGDICISHVEKEYVQKSLQSINNSSVFPVVISNINADSVKKVVDSFLDKLSE